MKHEQTYNYKIILISIRGNSFDGKVKHTMKTEITRKLCSKMDVANIPYENKESYDLILSASGCANRVAMIINKVTIPNQIITLNRLLII